VSSSVVVVRRRRPSVPIEFPRMLISVCMCSIYYQYLLSNDNYLCMISSLGSYLRVSYVSSGIMNEWKSNFGAVGGWTNVCIPCLISLLNA